MMIACLLILALRPGEHTPQHAVRLLALGLTLVAVADTNFAYQSLHDAYATGTLPDVGWSLGYMLGALGAFAARLAPTREATTAQDEPGDTLRAESSPVEQRVWRSLLPYVLVPAVGVLVVYAWRHSAGSGSLATGVFVGGTLLIGLMLLRQVLTIIENARLIIELREDQGEGEQALFSVTAAGRPAVTDVQLKFPEREQRYEAAAGEISAFSALRQATFRPGRDAGATTTYQLKVWAHKVTPEGDSEGIAGCLYVHQDGETRQFDLKLSKGQVVLPVAPGACQVDITLAGASDMRPGDFS